MLQQLELRLLSFVVVLARMPKMTFGLLMIAIAVLNYNARIPHRFLEIPLLIWHGFLRTKQ
jgi:hypothetical protein